MILSLFKPVIHEAPNNRGKKSEKFGFWDLQKLSSKYKAKFDRSFNHSGLVFPIRESRLGEVYGPGEVRVVELGLFPRNPPACILWSEARDLEEAGNLRQSRVWYHLPRGGLGKQHGSGAQDTSRVVPRQVDLRQFPRVHHSPAGVRKADHFPLMPRVMQMCTESQPASCRLM